jgi:hypothetical protein
VILCRGPWGKLADLLPEPLHRFPHAPEVRPLPVDPGADRARGKAFSRLADLREEPVSDLGSTDLAQEAVAVKATGEGIRLGIEAQGPADLDQLPEGVVVPDEQMGRSVSSFAQTRVPGK